MKKFVSWMSSRTGRRSSENSGDKDDEATNLPRGVQRVYMMEKDAGHRGPIVGAYLVDVFTEEQVVVIVTPSGVSVMTTEEGRSIAYRRPETGDAYTACALIPLSTKKTDGEMVTKNCGLVLGTQDGQLELLEVSSEDLKILHQCMEKTSTISAIERLRTVPSVVAVGTTDGRILLWDPVVHPFTPTVSLRVKGGEDCVIHAIVSAGESELWVSTSSNSLHVFTVAVDNSTKVRTLTCEQREKITDILMPLSDMVESRSQNLLIGLSSGSGIVLIDLETKKILHKYPARLMSCGAAVTSIAAFDDDESTFIVLGGVEGSLCIRELNRRQRDNKLQCLLLRCFDKLVPEKNELVGIPEECPISSLSIALGDLCVVGDAACSVFVINMSLQQWRTAAGGASEPVQEAEDEEEREDTREPSSEGTTAPEPEPPKRQQSIELPIESRKLPEQVEEKKEDELMDAPEEVVTKKDDSPKITVVSPKSNRSRASSHASPASHAVPPEDIAPQKESSPTKSVHDSPQSAKSPKSSKASPVASAKTPQSPRRNNTDETPIQSPQSSPKTAPQLEESSFSDNDDSSSKKSDL